MFYFSCPLQYYKKIKVHLLYLNKFKPPLVIHKGTAITGLKSKDNGHNSMSHSKYQVFVCDVKPDILLTKKTG